MHSEVLERIFPQMTAEKELKKSDRGWVYLVRDRESNQRYIYRSFEGSAEVYQKMQGIDCPYLPVIHQVKEEAGMVHVLEEYVQGDTLAFLLEGGTLTQGQAKDILTHVCLGLKELHAIGAVHRDVKPENIILRGSDAVLIDFDVSRLYKAESNESDTQIMGTTGYAAPEQYGFSQTDARADIYSLGIVLNEMLTGEHPSRNLAVGAYAPIIQKCTQINAEQRYASVEELIADLETPPKKRSKIWYALLAAAAVIVAVIAMFGGKEQDAQETFEAEQLEVADEAWEGRRESFGTPFDYDLDGDGEAEHYLFSMDNEQSPMEGPKYDEGISADRGNKPARTVWPCVWRVLEDGTMEEAPEFAQLLTDVETKVWRLDDFTSPKPVVWTVHRTWPGAVHAEFSLEADGYWIFDMSAKLGDTELTAVSKLLLMVLEEEVFVEERLSVTDEPWAGTLDTFGTPFEGDLNGDGVFENYIFAMDNAQSPVDGPIYEESISLPRGGRSGRTVWPCVFQVMEDGSMVEEPIFSEMLSDASIRVWRVDDFSSPEPEVWTVEQDWPGAVDVAFTLDADGLWVFDLTAYIGDLELKAVSKLQLTAMDE